MLSKFHCENHNLLIEKIFCMQKDCFYCKLVCLKIVVEERFLLICPHYENLRSQYFSVKGHFNVVDIMKICELYFHANISKLCCRAVGINMFYFNYFFLNIQGILVHKICPVVFMHFIHMYVWRCVVYCVFQHILYIHDTALFFRLLGLGDKKMVGRVVMRMWMKILIDSSLII